MYKRQVFQMDVIINGSDDIFLRNMLRDQLMDVLPDGLCQLFRIRRILFQDLRQDRIIYQLGNAQFFWITAVSYTHLDVYKRQPSDRSEGQPFL